MPEIQIKGVRLVVTPSELADTRYIRFLNSLDRRQLLRRRIRQRRRSRSRPAQEPASIAGS